MSSFHCCFFVAALLTTLSSIAGAGGAMDVDPLLILLHNLNAPASPGSGSSQQSDGGPEGGAAGNSNTTGSAVDGRHFGLGGGNAEDIFNELSSRYPLFPPGFTLPTTTSLQTTTTTTTTATITTTTTTTTKAPTESSTSTPTPTTLITNSTTEASTISTATETESGRFHGRILNKTANASTSASTSETASVKSVTKTSASRKAEKTALELDWSTCAVFPACSVEPNNQSLTGYMVTCHRPAVAVILFVIVTLAVAIVVSNLLIIVVISCTPSLRKPHGYFKLSIAVADILAGLIVLPVMVKNIVDGIAFVPEKDQALFRQFETDESAPAMFFCIVGILSSIATLYSLLLLTMDSYISIRWPMKYSVGEIVTTKRAMFAIALVWSVALIVAALPAIAKDSFSFGLSLLTFYYMPKAKLIKPDNSTSSTIPYTNLMIYAVTIWGIPFVATWCLTILTSVQSRRMLLRMKSSRRKSARTQSGIDKLDRNLRGTVVIVLLLFTVTVLPVFAIMAQEAVDPRRCTGPTVGNALLPCFLLFVSGSFLNVIVYNTCNKEFREATRKLARSVGAFLRGGPRQATNAAAVKRTVAYWQSPAGRSLWNARHAGGASGKSMRTLSGESAVTTSTNSRTKSTSSAGSVRRVGGSLSDESAPAGYGRATPNVA